MSSIWDNTYTLGNSSATVISAGPGIKIDDSQPGVIKVSNDETVLYSGNNTSAATITEPLSAFERINIYMNRGDYNVSYGQAATVLSFSVGSANEYVQLNWSLGANGWYDVFQKLTWTNNSVNVVAAHAIYGGNFTATSISHESNTTLLRNTIQKIIGINRKQNGGN